MINDKLLPKMRKNVSLSQYTAFKIGGKADYFFEAKNKKDLILALKFVKENKIPFFILGGGSNLLVSDKGFNGLVIKILFSKFYFLNYKIIAEAGARLGDLVNTSAGKSLTGLEWAAGIPGTLGGAINGNAGLPNESVGDAVKEVEVLDTKGFKIKIKKFKNKDCKFSYRDSVFKHKKNLVILSAILKMKKGDKNKIRKKIKKYLDHKEETQPLNYPSAGSVFVNPKGFFAAELIEKCNLKGKIQGAAKISEKHANFIVNLGKAEAKDVEKLIKLAKKQVKKKFKINLQEEIRYLS